jgi:choline dehydrogenase-like flavoprotein
MKKYDYIIVGSGVAGVTIAKRLLESDPLTSILMLDAGPVIPSKQRRPWWDYITLDQTPYSFTYDQDWEARSVGNINWLSSGTRVKAVGGSTMHWGAWCLRFKPEDFKLYTNTKEGADWPISYDDLEPYYNQAEEYLAVCGDDAEGWSPRSKPYPMPPFQWTAADGVMLNAFVELGIKPGKMPMARYRKCFTTGTCKYCPFGSRFSAQNILTDLLENKKYKNFVLRANTPVRKINCLSKAEIESIECLDNDTGKIYLEIAEKFIICSGSYETPKLLMNSKNEFWTNGIGNDADLLGRFIISHSMLKVKGRYPENKERWFQEYDFPTLMSRSYDTPERQKIGKIFLFKNRVLPNVDIASLMIAGKTPEEIDTIMSGPMEMELQAFMEEKGKFENRLQIAPGTDRFGLPLTTINFNRTETENANAKENLKLMEQVILKMGYEIVYSQVEDPGAHHTTGTCRMAKTAEDGVTDEQLKVHDIKNLYLCSNGVFPTGSAVNPTLTLTALSMRLSDHLILAQTKNKTIINDYHPGKAIAGI